MRKVFKTAALIFAVVAIVAALGFSDGAGAQGRWTIFPAGGSDGPPNL